IAGFIGFVGNESVAIFRIRVGRAMNSAALIADGYHARTDGLTSLAVVVGAVGVWLGFPLADPVIGMLITLAIFGIVWQSAKAVVTRGLDGVDPHLLDEIRHAASHVDGVGRVIEAKARWLGHELRAELKIAVDPTLTITEGEQIATSLRTELKDHIGPLRDATIELSSGAEHHAHEHVDATEAVAAGVFRV
ncbi:MAG: cation efflux protein, partial [Alphaproteobacteria bacterium]|nr:cation efflux protein [Alphaproteobacteria bacterium]